MKNNLLKSVILFCVMQLTFCQLLNAQIIYTDVNPDLTFTGASSMYHLDLNNDSTIDFDFSHTSYVHHPIPPAPGCTTSGSNNSAASKNLNAAAVDTDGAMVLSQFMVIDGSLAWNDTTVSHGWNKLYSFSHTSGPSPICSSSSSSSGNWGNQINKYLALRINVSGLTYYGWARLSTSGTSGFIIKDYAYNSIPNQAILAGESNLPTAIISGSTYCSNDSIDIPFIANAVYGTGNYFIAQLSDSSGSFNNPTTLDSILSNVSDTISTFIPQGLTSSNYYSIRIVSTNPTLQGPALNTFNLYETPSTYITNPNDTIVCIYGGHALSLYVNSVLGSHQNQWKNNGVDISGQVGNSILITQSGNYSVEITNVCGSSTSPSVVIHADSAAYDSWSFLLPDICVNDIPFILSGGSPQGGIYSGNFVSQNIFSPNSAGLGAHQISYYTTDSIGCFSMPISQTISVVNCTTGIDDDLSPYLFLIYSFNKAIHINLNDAYKPKGIAIIRNGMLQEVKKIKLENNFTQIDMSNYEYGIYFVSILTDEKAETRMIYLK